MKVAFSFARDLKGTNTFEKVELENCNFHLLWYSQKKFNFRAFMLTKQFTEAW